MKILFGSILLCFAAGIGVFAQAEIAVETITLAHDDAGKPGEAAESFVTTDVPIHCIIGLSSVDAVTVKMNLVFVKTKETVITVSYKTNGQQNRVRFKASPETIWEAGIYRVDVLLDSKLSKSLEFEIKKSPQKIVEPPPKPKPAPPKQRKPRSKKVS